MKKIPTAEEMVYFLEAKGTIFPNKKEKLRAKSSFIEFAKLHVEAALKEVSKKAEVEEIWDNLVNPSMGIAYGVDEDSILKAYPLTNIK